MRIALFAAATLFGYGVVVPLLLVGWLAVAALLSTGAGVALVRSGGLEHDVFERCARAGAALVVIVLFAICVAWILRLIRSSFFTRAAGNFVRHPVPFAALGLLAALAAVTVFFGRSSSPSAQYATTTVVLANTYFFALLAVLGSVVAVNAAWCRFHRWTVTSPARTGLCVLALTLLGSSGAVAQHLDCHERPATRLLTQIDLTPLARAHNVFDFQELALCIASGKLLAASSNGEPARACVERLAR